MLVTNISAYLYHTEFDLLKLHPTDTHTYSSDQIIQTHEQVKVHHTLAHTYVLYNVQAASDVRNHSSLLPGVYTKILPLDLTFPARETCEKYLPAIIGGFPGTLIYETIINYINTVQ